MSILTFCPTSSASIQPNMNWQAWLTEQALCPMWQPIGREACTRLTFGGPEGSCPIYSSWTGTYKLLADLRSRGTCQRL